ncbi:MAG: DUF2442 domain-containing protein [Elusimicrobia bacterium]|nr:DUF2442 domain-containing protein [Elusimicrobiota bacterium]
MKSKTRGKSTSGVEILNVSSHGLWIYVQGKEYALPFEEFPWFKEAKISDIERVEIIQNQHLYWPKLDIDLDLDSLENPEKYPLQYRP